MPNPVGRPRTTTDDLPKKSGIYGLCCPFTGAVKYVGQSKNIKHRVKTHLRGDGSKTPKSAWIEELKAKGALPDIVVLRLTDDLDSAEIEEIKKIGLSNLLNVHHGGEYEGRKEPQPWRVIGVSCPSKILYLTCRNVGVDSKVLDQMRFRVQQCRSVEERMRLELSVAHQLKDSPISGKIKKWFEVVAPRLETYFPEVV